MKTLPATAAAVDVGVARTKALWPEAAPVPWFQRSEVQAPIPGEDRPAVSTPPHPHRTGIEPVHIRGFRSLADA